ncbi:porin [Zobellella maritima]|uniref:porin n=1 Tax=Zobellella maritima TaxID=2059725 RepID=UPI000E30ACF5|nr:porin [Zobellella maritima]
MKKTILALTIPALFATSASAVEIYSAEDGSKVDFYGRVQYDAGELKHQVADSTKAENFGGAGSARLGTNVQYTLNNDVDLIGKLEWQVTAEGADDTKTSDIDARYAWAGFRFMDTTDLTFGRSQDPMAQALYLTDVFNIFGGAVAYGDAIGGVSDKTDDQMRVSYAANGVDLRAAYAFADADKQDDNAGKENQWSASAGYTFPFGLGLVAAYEQESFGNGADMDAWIVGASYYVDGLYVAGIYTEREKDVVGGGKDESEGYELVATYTVDAWTLLAEYSNEEFDAASSSTNEDTIDLVTLGVQYKFNPNTKVYAEYLINDNDANDDDLYGMGIQYNF